MNDRVYVMKSFPDRVFIKREDGGYTAVMVVNLVRRLITEVLGG